MQGLWHDIRYGARLMATKPFFTMIAVLCLGLGVGLNSAVFSMVNTFFFRPLPVEDPDRLVRMYTSIAGFHYASFSYPDYVSFNESGIFEGVLATAPIAVTLGRDSDAELTLGLIVSANHFDVAGVPARLGRTFSVEEGKSPGAHPVAVLSWSGWKKRFGGDPAIVGDTVRVNGHPFTVIGVSPQGFRGTVVGLDPDIFVPLAMREQVAPSQPSLDERGMRWLIVTGRLRPETSLAQTREAAEALGSRLADEYPETNGDCRPLLIPENESALPPPVRGQAAVFAGLMMALVALVLVIASVNVANLLLARAAARRREIGIRMAIGAGRLRLLRQLLTESVLLAGLGGLAGIGLAFAATRLLNALTLPLPIPIALDFGLDQRVLGFTLCVSLLAGILFGLAPAFQGSRLNLAPALKGMGRPGSGRGSSFRLGNLLVSGQIAISLMLLVTAVFFISSLGNARRIDPGFDLDRVLSASVDATLNGYTPEAANRFYSRLLERLRRLPGVESASLSEVIPLSGLASQQHGIGVAGYRPSPNESMSIDYNTVDVDFFGTMGIRLDKGRVFTEMDNPDSQPVLIVDRSFADHFFAGREAVGATVGRRTVVGVVETIRLRGLGEDPVPYMYYPLAQVPTGGMNVVMRTSGDPRNLAKELRTEVRALDPALAVSRVGTLRDQIGFAMLPAQAGAILLQIFAGLAMILSAVGLYGVIAYWVSGRTREIGIRIALGAKRTHVMRIVLGRGIAVTSLGVALGLAAAVALSFVVSSFLYNVDTTSPGTYLALTLLMFGLTLLACGVPAARAMRIQPLRALRYE